MMWRGVYAGMNDNQLQVLTKRLTVTPKAADAQQSDREARKG